MPIANHDEALKLLLSGKNVFLTGSAGSGKTYLISEFAKKTKKQVAITATTGIAAINIHGETIHRFLKIGISTRPEGVDKIVGKWNSIKRSSKPWDKEAWQLLSNLDCLVIDEVSMLRRDQFELIEAVLSNVLEDSRPFGNIQIIATGDFFQLPPVVTGYDRMAFKDLKDPYCFQSDTWKFANFIPISLNTSYRQSDPAFLKALEEIRIGKVSQETETLLGSRVGAKLSCDIDPVVLFPHKLDVAKENMDRILAIDEVKYLSEAEYWGKDYNVDILKKESPADDKLYYCKGAQVVMLTNDPKQCWANGTTGKIIDVDPIVIKLSNGITIRPTENTWERIEYKMANGKLETQVAAKMTQLPFKICYASSIHKSQGLSLDYVDLDLSGCFAPGQAYTALSRVRTLEGLVLHTWDKELIKADERVLEFYEKENII